MIHVLKNPMYRFLLVMTVCSTIGLQGWRMLFDNFAVHAAGLDGQHVGVIQSIREVPGFLTLLVVYVLFILREHRLAALSIVVMGAGIGLAGYFPTYWGLVFTTLVMSFGFHYFETTNGSLTLQYFDKSTSPYVLARLRSRAAISSILVGLGIWAMDEVFDFKLMYIILGCIVLAGGIWAFFQNPMDKDLPPQRKKLLFRKKYWLFYLLTFLSGARRQIFVTFALFLMVKKFNFTVQEITILFVVNNVINYFVSRLVGSAILRFGERKVLSLEYFSLVVIFICYSLVETKIVMGILFILDHLFFSFIIGIRTYFQKVADPEDIAPSMAMGFTINHIAAVVLPVLGGLLWMVDYRIVFFAGAGLGLVSLISAQMIRTEKPFPTEPLRKPPTEAGTSTGR